MIPNPPDDQRRRDQQQPSVEDLARLTRQRRKITDWKTMISELLGTALDKSQPYTNRYDAAYEASIVMLKELETIAQAEGDKERLLEVPGVADEIKDTIPAAGSLARSSNEKLLGQFVDFKVTKGDGHRDELPLSNLMALLAWESEKHSKIALREIEPILMRLYRALIEKGVLEFEMEMPEYDLEVEDEPEPEDDDAGTT